MTREPTRQQIDASRSRRRVGTVVSIALAVAFAALVIAATHNAGSTSTASSTPGTRAAASSSQVGALTLTSLDGQPVRLPAGRPGALFFSVSSCTSCLVSAQTLGTLKTRFGSGVDAVFISIDPRDPPAALRARRQSIGNPAYPFAIDHTATLYRQYDVTALGTTIIYNARGQILARLIEPGLTQLTSGFRAAGLA